MPEPVLTIENLAVAFGEGEAAFDVVSGVNVTLEAGRTLAIVGESGSGKTMTGRAIMQLMPAGARASGTITLAGRDMLAATEHELQRVRGADVAMVFQDSLTALSPYMTVGAQIVQAIRLHHPEVSKRDAMARAVAMLARVEIPDAEGAARRYPHEFSGGMRQRAVIAMALINRPALLIADEPTTALDVTVQAQILTLLRELQDEYGMAMLLISHDFGVVASAADDVLVMYAGREAEYGSVRDIFEAPAHPYTAGLRAATPRLDAPDGSRLQSIPGAPTSLRDAGAGCAFAPRCAYATLVGERCHTERPLPTPRPRADATAHRAACHLEALEGVS